MHRTTQPSHTCSGYCIYHNKKKHPLIMLNTAFPGPHPLLYYLLYFLTPMITWWPLWERVKRFPGRVGVWGCSLKWIWWLVLYPVKLSLSVTCICPSGFGQIFMLLWYNLSSVLNLFLHPLNPSDYVQILLGRVWFASTD